MLIYTEMFPPSFKPFIETAASINQSLAETVLSVVNDWASVYQELGKRLMAPALQADAAQARAVAGDDMVDDAPPVDDGAIPVDEDAEAVDDDLPAEPAPEAPPNAALAILTDPAKAAEAARSAEHESEAEAEQVSDDVGDDIAAEIAREAKEEQAVLLAQPNLKGEQHGQRE